MNENKSVVIDTATNKIHQNSDTDIDNDGSCDYIDPESDLELYLYEQNHVAN